MAVPDLFVSAYVVVSRPKNQQTTAATTPQSSYTHHAKSLGLKGIREVYHRAAGVQPCEAGSGLMKSGFRPAIMLKTSVGSFGLKTEALLFVRYAFPAVRIRLAPPLTPSCRERAQALSGSPQIR
jgi:hypothetical protein